MHELYCGCVKLGPLYFLLLFIIACICGNSAHAGEYTCNPFLNRTFGQRYDLMLEMYEEIKARPQKDAMAAFEQLEKCAAANGERELEYTIRLQRYRYYIIENHLPASGFEDTINSFIELLDKEGHIMLKAYAYVVFADYYWIRSREFGPGLEYLLRAYNIYADLPATEFTPKSSFIYELALKYYRFKDYHTAKRLLREMQSAVPLYKIPDEYNAPNLLGLCYRNTGQYDSALFWFNNALGKAEKKGRSVWVGILYGNMGITHYMRGNYAEAIPLLEKDITICTLQRHAMENVPKSLSMLADCYTRLGQTDKALNALEQLKIIIRAENFWKQYDMLPEVYRLMARVYYHGGQKDMAYAYFDSAHIKRDSFDFKESGLILAGAQHKVDAEKRTHDLQKINAERELERIKKNAWIVALLLASTSIILFINRQRIAHRRRSERIAAEKERVETELNNATAQLNIFTRSVQEKNDLIERFTAELERLSAQPGTVSYDEHNNALLQLQEATILTDKQWEDFRRMFEKVHSGYLNRLREKLPSLSPAETRIMALSKLKLSNKEMAGMLGISTDAVRMAKHRLRKKLNMTEEASIDELADLI